VKNRLATVKNVLTHSSTLKRPKNTKKNHLIYEHIFFKFRIDNVLTKMHLVANLLSVVTYFVT
jgi:hypothetical protein